VTIPLGNVRASSMSAPGSTSPTSVAQNVVLRCSDMPSVTMRMSGTAAPGRNNVIALSNVPNQAKGVGVQLIYNNAALAFNTPYIISRSAPSVLNVPIAARYFRTGDISGGIANASATLTFSYN
ncbi:fimbrial protein, partial [Dyella sp.]|uniref:fimbrial protein n=1 Tax=Dyella sp. TaxID=1869338 RepID=UPI002ED5EC8D